MVFDTGSSTLEVPGKSLLGLYFIKCLYPAAKSCGEPCKNQKSFDPAQSSTFINGSSSGSIIFGTGIGVTPVIGNNTQLQLQSAMDTVSIGNISVQNTTFYLINNQTSVFSIDPFDGIMGLGTVPESWFAGAVMEGLSRALVSYINSNKIHLSHVLRSCLRFLPIPINCGWC